MRYFNLRFWKNLTKWILFKFIHELIVEFWHTDTIEHILAYNLDIGGS